MYCGALQVRAESMLKRASLYNMGLQLYTCLQQDHGNNTPCPVLAAARSQVTTVAMLCGAGLPVVSCDVSFLCVLLDSATVARNLGYSLALCSSMPFKLQYTASHVTSDSGSAYCMPIKPSHIWHSQDWWLCMSIKPRHIWHSQDLCLCGCY